MLCSDSCVASRKLNQFGRSAEEAKEVMRAVIPYEVACVIVALGVAAATTIPLTHRDLASSVAFVIGCHAAPGADGEAPAWERLATAADTLGFYMGSAHLAIATARMIEQGRALKALAAVNSAANTSPRVTVTGTLQDITERCTEYNI